MIHKIFKILPYFHKQMVNFSLSYWGHHLPMTKCDVRKLIVATSRCHCCERHQINRPPELGFYTETLLATEKKILVSVCVDISLGIPVANTTMI